MSGATQDTLPPLPKLEADVDLMLDVFTHPTLRYSSAPMNPDYGDTNRLAELGSKVLDLTVTYHLYSERPFLDPIRIQERRAAIMADENLNQWLSSYGLKTKLRISPTDQHILEDPEQMRRYFHTYIGALYIRNGLPTIQTWISQLIDPSVEVNLPEAAPSNDQHAHAQSQMGYQSPQSQMGYPSSAQSQYNMGSYTTPQPQFTSMYAPPPSFPPPPLPGSPPVAAMANMNLVTLALVNQTAAQRGFQVTYPAEQVGPSHQPTWTVRCCMNGKECGLGVGKSQKIAKEEAARQAWTTMGWGFS